MFSSLRSPPLSSGSPVNPPLSRFSACPLILRRSCQTRPFASPAGVGYLLRTPCSTLARLAGESAALPPVSDRHGASHHAVQERHVGLAGMCVHSEAYIPTSRQGYSPRFSAAQGASGLRIRASQTSIVTSLKGHTSNSTALRMCRRCFEHLAEPCAWGAGAGLFRWRTHANEEIRTFERMAPSLQRPQPLSAAPCSWGADQKNEFRVWNKLRRRVAYFGTDQLECFIIILIFDQFLRNVFN